MLTVISAQNWCFSQRGATQRLHSFKFTMVSKSHSQHSEAAVCCLGCQFLILYACAHEVWFPDQRPRPLVWKRDQYTSEIASRQYIASFPGLPHICSSVCVQYNTRKQLRVLYWTQTKEQKRERPRNEARQAYEHHVGKALYSAAYL